MYYGGAEVMFIAEPAEDGEDMAHNAPDAERLARWIIDAADRALQLVADLDDAQMIGPLLPTVNPLIWEIGHLAWFQEKFVLREVCGREPLIEFADAL
ncbi:DinB family protein [Actinomadura adrarensis]|uniref:DinB family protein n=1 Tax=Actinomadura adrarensis TaxID=1819600 RepID=A0ABW3CI79_9ACTN